MYALENVISHIKSYTIKWLAIKMHLFKEECLQNALNKSLVDILKLKWMKNRKLSQLVGQINKKKHGHRLFH